MVNVRPQPAEPDDLWPLNSPKGRTPADMGEATYHVPRFNVLLTEDRPRPGEVEHWTRQLPRLLEPQGVVSYLVQSGSEAIDLAGRLEIHAAVIDLGTPVHAAAPRGGIWLLDFIRRMPKRPPIVIINSTAYSQQEMQRTLREALSMGAFSVLNKPIDLNELLVVLRKVIDRQYKGTWPL